MNTVENLILDLLEWVQTRERDYRDTMEAWRTSCPRLPVWEDATDRGLVAIERVDGRMIVRVTPAGVALLNERRPRSHALSGASASSSANARAEVGGARPRTET
jgi:hypothetical protein